MSDFKTVFDPPVMDKDCGGSGCQNVGVKVCSRCISVWYCCKECQVGAWKEHKKVCISPTPTVSAVPLPRSVASFGPMPTEKKAADRFMKTVMDRLSKMEPDDPGDKKCDHCNSPSLCFSVDIKSDGTPSGYIANAKWLCRLNHFTVATDASMGEDQECNCKINLYRVMTQPCRVNFVMPSQQRILLVHGLAPMQIGDGSTTDSCALTLGQLRSSFDRRGILYDAVKVENERNVSDAILKGSYSKIIMFGITNGFQLNGDMFLRGMFFVYLPLWIKAGGNMIMHGEGELITIMANVLLGERGKWHFCGDFYRRCKQSLNRTNPSIPTENFPRSYCMKSTMVSGVEPQDQIYSPKPDTLSISAVPTFGGKIVSPKRTAVAAAPLGSGIVMFIGDSNLENRTIELMLTV